MALESQAYRNDDHLAVHVPLAGVARAGEVHLQQVQKAEPWYDLEGGP